MTHPHRLKITTSVQRSRNPQDSPEGRKLCDSYQNFDFGQGPKSIASSPYRGRPWRGWMFLSFFLCAKESKRNGVWGNPPARGNTSLCECYGIPQWVKTHIFATFSKKVSPSLSQSDNGVLQCRNFVPDNERVWI